MDIINCVSFPPLIVHELKTLHSDWSRSCSFTDTPLISPPVLISILPAEQFFTHSDYFHSVRTIVFGQAQFLEETFSLGADEYLKDPWNTTEMILRAEKLIPSERILKGNQTLLICPDGIRMNEVFFELNKRESSILQLLNCQRNNLISYSSLTRYLGIRSDNPEKSLHVYISRLRKNLTEYVPTFFPGVFNIINFPGRGYMMRTACG